MNPKKKKYERTGVHKDGRTVADQIADLNRKRRETSWTPKKPKRTNKDK